MITVVRKNILKISGRVEMEYTLFLAIDLGSDGSRAIIPGGCAKIRSVAIF